MPFGANNSVQPHILTFQRRYAAVLGIRVIRRCDPSNATQGKMLAEIWEAGGLGNEMASAGYDLTSPGTAMAGSQYTATPLSNALLAQVGSPGWNKLGFQLDPDETSILMTDLELDCLVGLPEVKRLIVALFRSAR